MKTILRSLFSVVFLLFFSQEIVVAIETQGKLVTVNVHSQGLENNIFNDAAERNVSVYLPPGYETNTGKSYPVLYLLSWENSTEKGWFRIHADKSLLTILNNYIISGKIEPMIVVVPDGKNKMNGCWYTNSDLTGNWEDFIVKDLVAYTDAHFRTIPFAECRGIAGHSMGGYGALKLATKYSDVFSTVYALNAFVDFETVINDTVIWKSSVTKAIEANSFPTGDPFADKLLAMAATFAPMENNPPLYSKLFKTRNGDLNDAIVAKWLEQDPKTLISAFSDNLKSLKAIIIDCSDYDANIYLNSNYSKALNEQNIEHTFRYYSGNQESLLLHRVREFMLPMFSETFDHSLLTVLNYRHSFSKSDIVLAKLLKSGTIYVVPSETSGNLEEIENTKKLSIDAAPGKICEIPLKELANGIYRIYGVSSGGFIDKAIEFGVNGGIPTVKICAVDSYKGDEICCNITVNGITCPAASSGGFTISAMGDISLCLALKDYCTVEKTVTVYTDTTFIFPVVKDSYLKVTDKTSGEPVFEATVTQNHEARLTDANGLTLIQNLQNGTLDCRIFKQGYFTEEVSVPLIPGETATMQVTRKKASVNFVVVNNNNPVSGLTVLLNELEVVTDQNGTATFTDINARNEHTFQINGRCYENVKKTFYLETDTTIRLTLKPGISGPGMPIVQTGNSLLLKPELDGTFYIVPEGTEANLASVRENAVWTKYVLAGSEVKVNMNDFPYTFKYEIFFVAEECGNMLKRAQIITSLNEIPESEVLIYPNPVKDAITIQLNRIQPFRIEITNLYGKIIYQSEETGISHKVNLLSFSSGIYFVSVKSKDFAVTHKVLKQ
jgi:S-formylglutathione hydrolase